MKMETCLVKTLRWHLNPPAPYLYLTVVSPLITTALPGDEPHKNTMNVYEMVRYLLELSCCDSFFIEMKPSSVAYAAVLVALDILSIPRKCFTHHPLTNSPEMTGLCVTRLHQVYCVMDPQWEEDAANSPTTVSQDIS